MHIYQDDKPTEQPEEEVPSATATAKRRSLKGKDKPEVNTRNNLQIVVNITHRRKT